MLPFLYFDRWKISRYYSTVKADRRGARALPRREDDRWTSTQRHGSSPTQRRTPTRSGSTPHARSCGGSRLSPASKMEARALYDELLPRLQWVELAGEPAYMETLFVGGPKHLPIRYKLT